MRVPHHIRVTLYMVRSSLQSPHHIRVAVPPSQDSQIIQVHDYGGISCYDADGQSTSTMATHEGNPWQTLFPYHIRSPPSQQCSLFTSEAPVTSEVSYQVNSPFIISETLLHVRATSSHQRHPVTSESPQYIRGPLYMRDPHNIRVFPYTSKAAIHETPPNHTVPLSQSD